MCLGVCGGFSGQSSVLLHLYLTRLLGTSRQALQSWLLIEIVPLLLIFSLPLICPSHLLILVMEKVQAVWKLGIKIYAVGRKPIGVHEYSVGRNGLVSSTYQRGFARELFTVATRKALV